MKKKKSFYVTVAEGNENIPVREVFNVLVWYDLLGFAVAFQTLFMLAYSIGWRYSVTMFSTLFIILVDAIVKELLDRDVKNFKRLKKELPLVKLWTIPLLIMGVVITLSLLYITFFIR